MPSDDVLYSNIHAQTGEKGLEGTSGIIKLSSWLPQTLHLKSKYEFSDRTRGGILTFPLHPSPVTLQTTWWPGPPVCVWELFSHCASACPSPWGYHVSLKSLWTAWQAGFPTLSIELYKAERPYTLLLLQLHLLVLVCPRPLPKHLRCQFPGVDSLLHIFHSLPHAKDSVLPHLLSATHLSLSSSASLVTHMVTRTLFPQKSSALSDLSLPHPWWAFGCSTSSMAHRCSKKGKKRENPVTLIPTSPSLCFYCQMGLKGARKVQAWDIIQIQLTSLLWITSKQETLWGGCGQFPKTALVFFFSWHCTSGSPLRLELRQHAAAWGLLCAWAWIQRSQGMQRLSESRTDCCARWAGNTLQRADTRTTQPMETKISPKAWKETKFLQTILFLQYQQTVLKKSTSSFRKIHMTCSFSWEMFPSPKLVQTDASMSEAMKSWRSFMGNGSPKERHARLTLKLKNGKEWCQRGWLSLNIQTAPLFRSSQCSCYLPKGQCSWFSLPGYLNLCCLSQDIAWDFCFIIL